MKRIILCADGTWGTPTTSTPSNVVRLLRAIASQTQSQDGHCREQVVFYDWGIGSDALSAGAALTGNGIDKNIQDCYRFLVHNYAQAMRSSYSGLAAAPIPCAHWQG
jgi:uncharacterized protein (DUF2235 family)